VGGGKERRKTATRIIKRTHKRSEEKSSLISRDGENGDESKKGGKTPLTFASNPFFSLSLLRESLISLSLSSYTYRLSSLS
jgi:hypothetical protein